MALNLDELFEIEHNVIRRREITIEQLYTDLTTSKSKINPDPIGQRPPTNSGYQNAKNAGIIESILSGYGIDTIYLRDITSYDPNDDIRRLYSGSGYLTIDGGHRCRAVKWFIENRFYVEINGKRIKFRDLQSNNNPELNGVYDKFMKATVALKYVICTSKQAHKWFLMINKMTKTNEIESIMSDDESKVCEWIRRRTWFVYEYNNREDIHPIFEVKLSEESEYTTEYWNKANIGGSFYYHAFITLCKAIGNGNVDAGEREWKKIVMDNYDRRDNLTKRVETIWTKFFDDLKAYQKSAGHKKGLDDDSFGFFSCIWFHLLAKNAGRDFNLDMGKFALNLARVKTLLTIRNGTNYCKYDNVERKDITGNTVELKVMMREYIKAFSDGKKQEFAGAIILKELEEEAEDTGIIFLDSKRTAPLSLKEQIFFAQKKRCYIDIHTPHCKNVKKELTIDDCVWGHDTPHSKGGKLLDGSVICKACHDGQGLMNFDEYMKYLQNKVA